MQPTNEFLTEAEIIDRVETWLDIDAHSNKLPTKIYFSDIEIIAECIAPEIQALLVKATAEAEHRGFIKGLKEGRSYSPITSPEKENV